MFCDAKYVQCDVTIVPGKYSNGRLALVLVDSLTGEVAAKPTVNVPEADLAKDEIILKDYSEGEGTLDFFIKNGLVERTGQVTLGYVIAPVVKITDKLKAMICVCARAEGS